MTESQGMSDLSVRASGGMLWSLADNLSLQAVQLMISGVIAVVMAMKGAGMWSLATQSIEPNYE